MPGVIPGLGHNDLVALVHDNPVGTRIAGGFEIESRVEHGGGHWYEVVVSRGPDVWTISYLWHESGGRIVRVDDADGHQWNPTPDKSGWVDRGPG